MLLELDRLAVLRVIHDSPGITRLDILFRFQEQIIECDNILKNLEREKIISGDSSRNPSYRLTSLGVEQYLNLQKSSAYAERIQSDLEILGKQLTDHTAQQEERYRAETVKSENDKKKQFRNDLLIAAFSVIFGAAITLIIEHFADIHSFFVQLFSSVGIG